MKKLILVGLIVSCLTGCAVKSPSDNEIIRGMGTHKFLKQILENLGQIAEYQNKILEKLEDK